MGELEEDGRELGGSKTAEMYTFGLHAVDRRDGWELLLELFEIPDRLGLAEPGLDGRELLRVTVDLGRLRNESEAVRVR